MTDFFKGFPTVNYPLEGYASNLVDILTTVLPQRLNVDQTFVFQKYTIKSGETAMSIANGLYKDPTLDWTILIINDIVNPYTDWPMEDAALFDYTTAKYGGEDPYETIHHFEDARTGRYLDDVQDAYFRAMQATNFPEWIRPVSNWDYESGINLSKRNIIVVSQRYIHLFVDSFNKAIAGQPQ